MRLTLIRSIFTSKSTIGNLFVNGKRECFTLEDTVRPSGVKVYGETAIPHGVYDVIVTPSARFKRDLPRLVNVPMFEGILIHPGNTAVDTHGCILVGQSQGVDFIGNSKAAFNILFEKIKSAKKRGEAVTIEIIEQPA